MPTIAIDNHFSKAVHTALSVPHTETDNSLVFRPTSLQQCFMVENYAIQHQLAIHFYSDQEPKSDAVITRYGWRQETINHYTATIVVDKSV